MLKWLLIVWDANWDDQNLIYAFLHRFTATLQEVHEIIQIFFKCSVIAIIRSKKVSTISTTYAEKCNLAQSFRLPRCPIVFSTVSEILFFFLSKRVYLKKCLSKQQHCQRSIFVYCQDHHDFNLRWDLSGKTRASDQSPLPIEIDFERSSLLGQCPIVFLAEPSCFKALLFVIKPVSL